MLLRDNKSKMAFARPMQKTTLLCLPEELFDDITSWLDEKDFCSMERSNRRIHTIVSKPCRTNPAERVLDLETLWDFEAASDLRPRALRFGQIPQAVNDNTSATAFLHTKALNNLVSDAVQVV